MKNKYLNVSPQNLPVGSVVFFYSPNYLDMEKAQHVAICIGHEQHVDTRTGNTTYVPQLAHCTYNDNRTILGAVRSGITKKFSYFAFTPNDPRFGNRLKDIAISWTNKKGETPKITYDKGRRDRMLDLAKQHLTAQASLDDSQAQFNKPREIFEPIKFAAREANPISNESTKGMHCVQFVTLIIQIALLQELKENDNSYYSTARELQCEGATGISIKHGHFDKYFEKDENLKATCRNLNAPQSPAQHTNKIPVIMALGQNTDDIKWRFRQIKHTLLSAPLAAKHTSPAALLLFLSQQNNGGGGTPKGHFGPTQLLNPMALPGTINNKIPIISSESGKKVELTEAQPDTFLPLKKGELWQPQRHGDPHFQDVVNRLLATPPQTPKRKRRPTFKQTGARKKIPTPMQALLRNHAIFQRVKNRLGKNGKPPLSFSATSRR